MIIITYKYFKRICKSTFKFILKMEEEFLRKVDEAIEKIWIS
jgi:hypothetical protein